jgi:penicillin-binding protein 2
MELRTPIPDPAHQKRLITRRSIVALLVMLVLAGVISGRMVSLQVFGYQHFATLSQQNRVRLIAVPPTRGLIYDRNGVVLAENRPSFRLMVTPEQVPDMNDTLKRLGAVIDLSEADLARFRELIARKPRFEAVPLKFHLAQAEVARLAVDRHRFPGVEVEAQLTRHYPLGEVAVHAVGYVGRINAQELQRLESDGRAADYSGTSHIGKTGVERYYEDLLHGSVGVERVETNALGRAIRTLERTPPVSGKDIYLTLDIRLQQAAEQALEGYSGAIVALDPGNGEVLALVSNPGYDPNLFVNGIDLSDYRALQTDRDQPLFNRALRGQYPPGSTVKPFIGLAALENGTITLQDKIFCPGYYQIPGNDHRYRGWKNGGHGWQNLTDAIAESNDIFFYNVAYRLGIDAMSRFMKRFNFGADTGIDLPGERAGIVPSREWKRAVKGEGWYHGETVITGIGQGYTLATPLQLAYATALLANRGSRVQPHILRAARAAGAETVTAGATGEPIRLKDPAHWEQVIKAMRRVVHGARGTARRIGAGIDYTIAGKTGTAQVFGIAQDEEYNAEELAKRLHDHALFIAFAPVEAPRIALAVIAENGGSGSGTAAPIARKVLDAYMELISGTDAGGGTAHDRVAEPDRS